MVFSEYANFYDLYYADKNYGSEADFILSLAKKSGKTPQTLLDMGCGTGRHLAEFLKKGLRCDGFDLSNAMLDQAKKRLEGRTAGLCQGNLRSFSNSKQYDLVVSMFAVMGYLINNDHLVAGLSTARKHLRPDGLFIFDGWFGPAVLAQKPEERCHTYRDGEKTITRKAVPTLDPCAQSVSIDYTVTITENGTEKKRINERHTMRFFFIQEIALAMNAAGLQLLGYCPFLESDAKMTIDTWNVTFVAGLRK